jgi:glucose-1-phosphatase
MTKPSIVVFDLGKVLVEFDYSIASNKIAERSGLQPAEVKKHFDYSPLLFRYETGLMTRQEFYEETRRATQFPGDLAEFSLHFADIFSEISPMIQLHAALRRAGVPTYIFSNTNDLAIAHIRRNFPFFENFDGYILSYEVGAMKPDVKIYEALEQLSGKRGAEILYLDDRQENVDAGAARGWQVILQTEPEKTLQEMAALGLPVR